MKIIKGNFLGKINFGKSNSKSQAALEFLTTYGWAFLVILIMIAALAYFGILSPSKLLPNRCNFGSEFQCVDYRIDATSNEFKIRLKNNLGEPINIDAKKVTLSSESIVSYNCTGLTVNPGNIDLITSGLVGWKAGDIKEFIGSTCNSAPAGIVTGDRGKIGVAIKVYASQSGPAYEKEIKGEVFATVQ